MPSLPTSPDSAPVSGAEPPPPEPEAPRRRDVVPWPAWTAPAGLVLGLGLGAVASSLAVTIGDGGRSLSHATPAANIAGDILFDLGFVAAAIYLANLGHRARPADFGFRRVRPGTAVRAFILAVIAYYGLSTAYASVFHLHRVDKLPSGLGVNHSTAALIAASIFVCVIAPIAEELFFRGFFFGALRRLQINLRGRELGTWVAALVTSVLFGLAHKGSAPIEDLIPLGFLGFVLCVVRWRTASLYPCIALHAANNALALGVNQLGWGAGEIVGLILGACLLIGLITGPVGARSPALA